MDATAYTTLSARPPSLPPKSHAASRSTRQPAPTPLPTPATSVQRGVAHPSVRRDSRSRPISPTPELASPHEAQFLPSQQTRRPPLPAKHTGAAMQGRTRAGGFKAFFGVRPGGINTGVGAREAEKVHGTRKVGTTNNHIEMEGEADVTHRSKQLSTKPSGGADYTNDFDGELHGNRTERDPPRKTRSSSPVVSIQAVTSMAPTGTPHATPPPAKEPKHGIAFPTVRTRPGRASPLPQPEADGLPQGSVRRRSKPSLSGFLRTVKAGATTGLTRTGAVPAPPEQLNDVRATEQEDPRPPTRAQRTSSRVAGRPPSQQRSSSRASRQDAVGGTVHIPPSIIGTISPPGSRGNAGVYHLAYPPVTRSISPALTLSGTTSHFSAESVSDPSTADADHYTLRIACTFLVRSTLAKLRALRAAKSLAKSPRRGSTIRPESGALWFEAESMRRQMENDLLSMERMERAWGIEWMLRRSGSDAPPVWAQRTKQKELDTFRAGLEDGLVLCFLLSRSNGSPDDPGMIPTQNAHQRNLDIFMLGAKALGIAEVARLQKGHLWPMNTAKAYFVAKIIVALARVLGPDRTSPNSDAPESPRSEDDSALTDVDESPQPSRFPNSRHSPGTGSGDSGVDSTSLLSEGLSLVTKRTRAIPAMNSLPTPILHSGGDAPTARVSFTKDHGREPTPSLVTSTSITPRTSTAYSSAATPVDIDFAASNLRPSSPFAYSSSRSPRHLRPIVNRGVSLGGNVATTSSVLSDAETGLGPPKLRARASQIGSSGNKVYAPKQFNLRRDSGLSIRADSDGGARTPPATPSGRRDTTPRPGFTSRRSSQNTPEKVRQRQSISIEEDGKPSTSYTLGNLIGKGQFGEVYRAMGKQSGDFVAVKRIDVRGLAEREVRDILNEVELLKGLSHPGIVKYYGMRRDDSVVDIVLEYVDGGSLLSTLKAFGQFSEQVAASYTARILDGLIYLHGEDVIHCDLKCANILITSKGSIKITDFGISLNNNTPRLDQLKNNIAGSPNWMAPEVIELKGPSPVSDIWASGCTVIEMLTGSPPYSDVETNMAVMFRIVEDDMPLLPDEISHQCESFLRACFIREVADRPSARTLFAHPWIQNHLMLEPTNSRSVDASIPFIKRISREWQDNSPHLKHMASKRTSLNTYFMSESTMSMHRHERSSSTSPDIAARAEHAFVPIKFSTAIACRLCALPLRIDAVFCQECGLVCHSVCAQGKRDTCDAKKRGALEAISRRQTNFSEAADAGSLRSVRPNMNCGAMALKLDNMGRSKASDLSIPALDGEEQRRLALLKLTGGMPTPVDLGEPEQEPEPHPSDKFTRLPTALYTTIRRPGRQRPMSDQTQTRTEGTNTRAALRPFSSTPHTRTVQDGAAHNDLGEGARGGGRDCVMM